MLARRLVATGHWRVRSAFNTCWTKLGPSEGPRPKVGDSAALASSCARSVRSVRLRSLLVRARRIDRPDARAKGRETNLSMGVVAMSQGARPSPRSPAPLSPRSRHRRRRPETKGGIPLSTGRDRSHGR